MGVWVGGNKNIEVFPHSIGVFGVEYQFQHHDRDGVGNAQGAEMHAHHGHMSDGIHFQPYAFLGDMCNGPPDGGQVFFVVGVADSVLRRHKYT